MAGLQQLAALLALVLAAGASAGSELALSLERPQCPPAPALCRYDDSAMDEHFYYVENDKQPLLVRFTPAYFYMKCPGGVSLESGALPRFPRPVRVARLKLERCAPPAELSYAAALRRLNVSVIDRVELLRVPDAPPLGARHLADLPPLAALDVSAASPARPLRPHPAFLQPLDASLHNLYLTDVVLEPAALLLLPRSLLQLSVRGAGLREFPRAALARLPALRTLVLAEDALRAAPPLDAAPSLAAVSLSAPLTAMPPLHRLENATLGRVQDVRLVGECGALRRLTLMAAPLRALPLAWLQETPCAQLDALEVVAWRSLSALPARLAGVPRLTTLAVRRCPLLQHLPSDLFADTRHLHTLDLSRNSIAHLPSDIFAPLTELRELDLSSNRLGLGVGVGGVGVGVGALLAPLAALTSLQRLWLAGNPLGDLCSAGNADIRAKGLSPLWPLTSLRALSLSETGASRLCVDWRRDLRHLERLDFKRNNITQLQFADLQWERSGGARVALDLSGNNITRIVLEPAHYKAAAAAAAATPALATVEMRVDSSLRCDCLVYWFARALRERLLRAAFSELRCAGHQPRGARLLLGDIDMDSMVCAEADACAPACSCVWRPRDGVRVASCERAGLGRLPRLPPAGRAAGIELLAAGNRIRDVLPEELPRELRMLDLSNNLVSELDARVAGALFAAPERRVRLAGNPLRCSCALLTDLRAHQQQVLDYENVTCVDGRGVRAVRALGACGVALGMGVGVGGGVGAALGVLAAALALAALGAWAARRHSRLRLKAFLLARGLCLRWARPDDDDDCKYDAFLSFSHRDNHIAEQLIAELESGARPLRLCVHHRDWRAGDWIPAQIARSVAQSRRTLVLVSEHFARSSWARAEFREAHARALRDQHPRLIVVLLEDAPPAGIDDELRNYIQNNTYVRWGEPAFWEKLRVALPPGRGPRPRPRPSRTPAPAPAARPAPPSAQPASPPTPIVKFASMDFTIATKKEVAETSPCA